MQRVNCIKTDGRVHQSIYRLTLCPQVIFHACFLSSADFIQNQLFREIKFRNTIRVSNRLDPDQVRHFVGPDLGPNCLQSYQQTTLGGKELDGFPFKPKLQANVGCFNIDLN